MNKDHQTQDQPENLTSLPESEKTIKAADKPCPLPDPADFISMLKKHAMGDT